MHKSIAALGALLFCLAAPLPGQAANVLKFAAAQAINWRGEVINIEPLSAFYKRQFFKGIWTGDKGLSRRGEELIAVIGAAGADGLEPRDYLGALPADPASLSGDDLSALELYLSQAALHFSRDLFAGRTTPSISEPDIVIARKQLDTVALLDTMNKNGVAKVIGQLRPAQGQYRALRDLLARTDDPAKRRKIIVNMERWRWLPRDLGDTHVLVNVAAFEMLTESGGKTIDRRKVIVGEEFHKTPMFSDKISFAQFNPTWTISRSIAGNEILPHLRTDANYLQQKGYVLYTSWEPDAPAMSASQIDWSSVNRKNFPYRIVQPAGPDNVLGQVKFLFPNRFNVYLHDTSSRQLFAKEDRALSHGCIRVEHAMEYAKLLYSLDNSLAPDKIDSIAASDQTTDVKLRRPIPIHLTYFTLWVEPDGKLSDLEDIYSRDKSMELLLFGGA